MKKTAGLLAFLLIIALTSSLVTPVLAQGLFDMECPDCHGTGEITVEETCPTCNGTGEYTGTCPTCHGTGEVEDTCPTCNGTGEIKCPYCHPDKPGYITCPKCNGDVYHEPLKWEEAYWSCGYTYYTGHVNIYLDIKNVDNVAGSVEVELYCEATDGTVYSSTFSERLEPGETAHFYEHFYVPNYKEGSCGYNVTPEDVEVVCPVCGGTGLVECPECHGTGKLTCPDCDGKGTITVTCPTCGGAGTYTGTCPDCDGTGKVESTVTCPRCNGRGYVTNWMMVGGVAGGILVAATGVGGAYYFLKGRRRKTISAPSALVSRPPPKKARRKAEKPPPKLKLERDRIKEMLDAFKERYEEGDLTEKAYSKLRSKYEERLLRIETALEAGVDKEYVASVRALVRLEELKALNKIDEETYLRLKKEYEQKAEKKT